MSNKKMKRGTKKLSGCRELLLSFKYKNVASNYTHSTLSFLPSVHEKNEMVNLLFT